MDAVTAPGEPTDAEAAIRAALVELDRAEQLARLDNDPTAHTLHALRVFLGSTAALGAEQRRHLTEHRQHVDQDFQAVRQARDDLLEISNQTVAAAKAEVEAAHADMARTMVGAIAHSAEQRLAAISRWIWWRTLALGSALAVAILALGFGLGYWRGNAAGYDQAAASIQASGPVEKAVLAAQGPAALHQWHALMRDNGILATMKADCAGKNIAHQNGRTACHLWLWTTPYVAPAAHG